MCVRPLWKCKSSICSVWWSYGKLGKVAEFVDSWDDNQLKKKKKERNHSRQHFSETESQWNCVTQNKENIKFSSYSADWPAHFKTLHKIKNVKLSIILNQDQEAVGCSLDYLPSVRKKAMWKSRFSVLMRLACRTSSPILCLLQLFWGFGASMFIIVKSS